MIRDITELYCFVDDFCKAADKHWVFHSLEEKREDRLPTRTCRLKMSEIVTIILLFHQSPCKNFKYFYQGYLPLYKTDFPHLLSYTRFISVLNRSCRYFMLLLSWLMDMSHSTGISYVDSSAIKVCENQRISRHKVFEGLAPMGWSSKGWFLGFKLHLVINEKGQLQSTMLTPGNIDERKPLPKMVQKLQGLLFADKGYISKKMTEKLQAQGLKLITNLKANMKKTVISMREKMLLKKRVIIETVFDVLKNKFQIEHSRHRSPLNAMVHIFSTLVAYQIKHKKPSINFQNIIQNQTNSLN